MATIGTKIYLWLFAKLIGEDQFGNKYYQTKTKNAEGYYKRMIIYNGISEPSKIPPEYHAWIHYNVENFPQQIKNYSWQMDHLPNLTGTKNAYYPDGCTLANKAIKNKQPKGSYVVWKEK